MFDRNFLALLRFTSLLYHCFDDLNTLQDCYDSPHNTVQVPSYVLLLSPSFFPISNRIHSSLPSDITELDRSIEWLFGCFESTGDRSSAYSRVCAILPIQSLLQIFRLSYLLLPRYSDRVHTLKSKSTMPAPTSETIRPDPPFPLFFSSLPLPPPDINNAASIFRLDS